MTHIKSDFLSDDVLEEIFSDIFEGKVSEGKDVEFKEGFGWRSLSKYMRTMAGFANTQGGYLIFGVEDQSRLPCGISGSSYTEFCNLKAEKMSTNLRDHFHQEINWDYRQYSYQGLMFGVIYTFPGEKRPTISLKDSGDLRKSAIYYRYHSQTAEIEPGDLVRIIEEEQNKLVNILVSRVVLMGKEGVTKTTLLNLESGVVDGGDGHVNVVLPPDILQNIRFVQEGHFSETVGDPTLRLLGTVQNAVAAEAVVVKQPVPASIGQKDVYEPFLLQQSVDSPEEFLRQICYFSSVYFPVYYYIRMWGVSFDEVERMLGSIEDAGVAYIRGKLLGRLQEFREGKRLLREIPEKPKGVKNLRGSRRFPAACRLRRFVSDIRNHSVELPNPRDPDMKYFLLGVQSLQVEEVVLHKEYVLSLLYEVFTRMFLPSACDTPVKTEFRKAVCWVDEALYCAEGESEGVSVNV